MELWMMARVRTAFHCQERMSSRNDAWWMVLCARGACCRMQALTYGQLAHEDSYSHPLYLGIRGHQTLVVPKFSRERAQPVSTLGRAATDPSESWTMKKGLRFWFYIVGDGHEGVCGSSFYRAIFLLESWEQRGLQRGRVCDTRPVAHSDLPDLEGSEL